MRADYSARTRCLRSFRRCTRVHRSYEAHGAARMLYAYGILGQQYLSGCWTTIAITAPFSNNRPGVVRLTKLCTDQQLEPIHILDVIHDFMDLETRPF